jgi:hypothetical protein
MVLDHPGDLLIATPIDCGNRRERYTIDVGLFPDVNAMDSYSLGPYLLFDRTGAEYGSGVADHAPKRHGIEVIGMLVRDKCISRYLRVTTIDERNASRSRAPWT